MDEVEMPQPATCAEQPAGAPRIRALAKPCLVRGMPAMAFQGWLDDAQPGDCLILFDGIREWGALVQAVDADFLHAEDAATCWIFRRDGRLVLH
jgi:hypothetical protein